MGAVPATVRFNRVTVAVPQVTFAIAMGVGVNEGETIDGPNVTCALNGYVPVADEIARVYLTTATSAEFLAAFPGEVQALASAGDLPSSGYTSDFIAAMQAAGHVAVLETVDGINAIRLDWLLTAVQTAGGSQTIGIDRVTNIRAGDNGARRLVHQLKLPGAGTSITGSAIASAVILDVTGEPAPGALAYFTVEPDLADTPHVETGAVVAVPGTVIGEIKGYDSTDVELGFTTAPSLVDTLGDRFAVAVISGNRRNLVVGATGLDWEDLVGQQHKPFPLYKPTVSGASGNILEAQLIIRPRYPLVNADGNTAGPTTTVTDYASLIAAFQGNGGTKTVKISDAWTGVNRNNGASGGPASTQPYWAHSHSTLMGNPTFAMQHNRGWIFEQGDDILVYNMAFRVGADLALIPTSPSAYKQVDNGNTSYFDNPDTGSLLASTILSRHVRNMKFLNCSFALSNDELFRVKGRNGWFTRGIMFDLCLFFNSLFAAGHPNGDRHNLGLSFSPGHMNAVVRRSMNANGSNRMPRFNRVAGAMVQNCIGHNWMDINTRGCVEVLMGDVGAGVHEYMTARIENNLFDQGGAATKLRAINLQLMPDPNKAWVYHAGNHFFDKATDDFSDQPLSVGNGINLNGTDAGVIRATPPFELAEGGYILMPTATEANRRAVEDLICGPVNGLAGCRLLDGNGQPIPGDAALNSFDRDRLDEYRAGTSVRDYTAAQVDIEYAADWNGPGTRGHGMAVLLP